jgi:hypothetical protein
MFNPIEWLKKLIQEITHDYANMAFDLLEIFMLKPTDFSKYPYIDTVYDFVFDLASSLCVVFVAWAILGIMFNQMAGVQSRSLPEVLFKACLAFVLSASAPWLLEKCLLKLNNAIVQYFLDEGLNTKMLEKFVTIPQTAGMALFIAMAFIVVLFLILGYQFITRLGEYVSLLVISPIAAHSIISENMEIWSVWWRESCSVILSQGYQVAILWAIINMLTGTEKLLDYWIAIGLMIVVLKGPKHIRQILYSSGGGRAAVDMAGGTGKAVMYKYMASRIPGK